MSTRSSIFYASDETVTVHVFHELADKDPDAYFLELTGKDTVLELEPAHFCVRLPRNVALALRNWIISAQVDIESLDAQRERVAASGRAMKSQKGRGR